MAAPPPSANGSNGSAPASKQYDLTECLGFEYPAQPVSWNTRDLILYALTIGASKTDYPLIYEKDPGFMAFPTFSTALSFKGEATDVVDFAKRFGGGPKPPGLPTFDPTKLVQGSQFVETLKPIPNVSGSGWTVTKRVVGIHEDAKGVTLDNELHLVSPSGEKYARLISQATNLTAVANGVPFEKMLSVGITPSITHPALSGAIKPTWTIRVPTLDTASVFFRLNGDYNPLHIDPAIGVKLGYGGLICHGLGQYSYVTKAIIDKIASRDARNLKAIYAYFSGPVTPGDTIEVKLWDIGRNADGTAEIAFEARALATGKVCLGEGLAHITLGEIAPDPPVPAPSKMGVSTGVGGGSGKPTLPDSANAYTATIKAAPGGIMGLVPFSGFGLKGESLKSKFVAAVGLTFLLPALAANVLWAVGWRILGFQ